MADFIETQGTLHDKNHLFKCQVVTAKTNPFIRLRHILSLTLNPTTNLKFYYFSPFLNEFLIESCAFWIVFATVRCFYVKVPSAGSIVCEMT